MRNLSLLLFFVNATIAAYSQSLPKIQKLGVYAPNNIKIDGKANEWNGKYEAYDKKNDIYYTIANDNNNIYLLLHTSQKNTINKIFYGGITFTLTSARQLPISVSYPQPGNNGDYLKARQVFEQMKNKKPANTKALDDLVRLKNTQFENSRKLMGIRGISEFSDPWISIYNTNGIKVKALFDDDFAYTYEVALPLKYLPGGVNKLRYDIKLNGGDRGDGRQRPPAPVLINNATGEVRNTANDMDQLYMENPTNFGGEYVLARK
ncbi:MAG TPA: hypothetical protein VL490_04620 [Mucilaginibacter sp.]|jgi:hypothetical protein|nr:hypothetical protein [Mucilaginibacter sp.]